MNPRLSKILALICFVLFIGLFLSYRTGHLDNMLPFHDAVATTTATDTLPQAYKDSLALDFLMDSLAPPNRLSTSKSMVLMRTPNPRLKARLQVDTNRLRQVWQLHGKMLTTEDSIVRRYRQYRDSVTKRY